tara:strand:+ start:325 stop:573 length:249 start_codon:yes stop_codon:yes gene_type:complete
MFTVGPFSEVSRNIEDFNTNLAFTTLFNQSVEQYQKLEKEYLSASFAQDTETMAKKQMELDLAQGTFQITANLMVPEEELWS